MLLLRRTCSKRFSHPKEKKEAEGTGGAPRQQGAHSASPSSLFDLVSERTAAEKGARARAFLPQPSVVKIFENIFK